MDKLKACIAVLVLIYTDKMCNSLKKYDHSLIVSIAIEVYFVSKSYKNDLIMINAFIGSTPLI